MFGLSSERAEKEIHLIVLALLLLKPREVLGCYSHICGFVIGFSDTNICSFFYNIFFSIHPMSVGVCQDNEPYPEDIAVIKITPLNPYTTD